MIELRDVWFRYREGPFVLQSFTAAFPRGVSTILGPNGSGKTTLLRVIAGILKPERGVVTIDGRPPERLWGRVVYLPQSGGLYPWMSNRENIALPLKLARRPRREIETAVVRAARALGVAHLLDKYPREVSGGEQQRVLLARAVASGAEVWLLDEPLSMVDVDHRSEIARIISDAVRGTGSCAIVVTHNIKDVVELGGRAYIARGPPLSLVAELSPHECASAEALERAVRALLARPFASR
ncbi:MAG: ATP-binding cassette domain-containing protein [Thermoproteaceae archaeon]|nr:ATP-binding cassette domain-containing protein [Thermoproteaceae archaeon]